MIQLRGYQDTAVRAITGCFMGNLGTGAPGRQIVLDAPTGSGKTVMLADLLDRACRNVVVLWVTPGKGDLEEQSHRALRQSLTGSPIVVERLTAEYLSATDMTAPGTVLVLNWEEVTQRAKEADPATGARPWTNLLAKGSEAFPGLFAHLADTAATGTEIVVIIDESHYGRGTDTSSVREFLTAVDEAVGYPAMRVEASATPIPQLDVELVSEGRQRLVRVKLDDVIADGMLAKEIRVNAGLGDRLARMTDDEAGSVTTEQLVLEAAWDKTLDLRRQYEEIGSPVRPLLIVQLPNDTATNDAAKQKRRVVEEFFSEHGITVDNGRMLVWLSGEERDETAAAHLADFQSPVEVLLFKQGISLGWDCPRAQVLLAFRDMASDIFRIQTIGRILRMPERRHYNDPNQDDLDCAFVYSNIKVTTHLERDPGTPGVTIEATRRFEGVTLPASYSSRAGAYNDLLPANAREWLANSAHAAQVYADLAGNASVTTTALPDTIVDSQTVTVAEVMAGKVLDDEASQASAQTADAELAAGFDAIIRDLVSDWPTVTRSSSAMRNVVYGWLQPLWQNVDEDEHVRGVQRLLLSPLGAPARELLREASQACRAGASAASKSIKEVTYVTPEHLYALDNGCTILPSDLVGQRHLYAGPDGSPVITTKTLSGPEKAFIDQIAEWVRDDKVDWWWKNGEGSSRYFSIAFVNDAGENDTTYPDFIIKFRDGRLLVAETKQRNADGAKQEFALDDDARHKAAALGQWQHEGALAGVTYQRGETWMIAQTLSPSADVELSLVLRDLGDKRTS